MSACRSCQAEVVFVRSAKSGKRMILDARPEKRVVLVADDGLVGPIEGDEIPDHLRALVINTYVDHHATCPQADQWRRGRRPAGVPIPNRSDPCD